MEEEIEKLRKLGKAKYGLKFIRAVAPEGKPFLVLEHRGYMNRRMADLYLAGVGAVDEEYARYFGGYRSVNETMKSVAKSLAKAKTAEQLGKISELWRH